MTRITRAAAGLVVLAAVGMMLAAAVGGQDAGTQPASKLAQAAKPADKLFDDKNYAEAAGKYEAAAAEGFKADPAVVYDKDWHHLCRRVEMCKLRLQLFDDALSASEVYVARCKGTPMEARAERQAGNLYMLVPHWGTRAGGKFHRAKWEQGIQVRSYQFDKRHALAHMDRARELYAACEADPKLLAKLPEAERKAWRDERVECIFDLASACSRFSIYENQSSFWWSYWGERDDAQAETAGERDFDEYHNMWDQQRQRPIGLRVGPTGEPVFPEMPKAYAKDAADDVKLLYLLGEARELDATTTRKYTALSWYRQAMLARARFGMDRLTSYAGAYWDNGKSPLLEEMKEFNPWEMKDSEALVLAGGKIRKVTLPAAFDVMKLLRLVETDFGPSGIADEAQYAVAGYFQSRQQYLQALGEYDKLKQKYASSKRTGDADSQIQRIKAPQVSISPTGAQLPGQPAKLQLSHRNCSKVWFVARRLDAKGFMEEIRNQPIDADKGLQGFWGLQNWSTYFANDYPNNDIPWTFARKYVGAEIARWSDEVKDDGTHRYAHVTLQTALKDRGTYLIYVYTAEPPADHAAKKGKEALALGDSRAVFALEDLAIVDKHVKDGNLYFICDAVTGAPVANANVDVLEVWSVWDEKGRKSIHHKAMHNLTTNNEGQAVLDRKNGHLGQLHALVRAGEDRLAWTGMTYWNYYNPSMIQSGLMAYCITDRPVYRPQQTVRFKVWLRQMEKGILANQPGREVTITVYDPKGNQVYTVAKQADQFGGLDGDFTLGAEPPLGVYRLHVNGHTYLGGQNFRVEEYKKPEFEVAVEPGSTHVKLGDKVPAVIKATYYFGGPVTDATVKYKVFREEYTHSYYFPGQWDWLYGPGYGWCWYEYPWFPWWGGMRCCWCAPVWWWGWYGGGGPSNPVRELVQQGETTIGADGTVKVEVDSAAALREHGDRDHRYVIQAEVRDASRRVITGEGAVIVTRQAFYAFVQADGGYYAPGEEMLVRVRCLTPDNKPVQIEGLVEVSYVVFGGPENAKIEQKELERFKATTNEQGYAEFRLRAEKSGQYRIHFTAPDKWGGAVEGNGLVWVCGRDFDGKLYRFNDLEILTDKRTYQPGETAHLMVNTRRAGGYVLFADEVDSNAMLKWRLLHLPDRHTVVDIPITASHRPNFFVEATTVSDTRVHQQTLQICVPPENAVMKVAVVADKPVYKPGEKATVKVTATDTNGKGARAEVALSAFDKSVLYIQGEYTPSIAKFFHGNLRYHQMQMVTNLTEQYSAWGYLSRPFENLTPYAASWWGVWGPSIRDWRLVDEDEIGDLGGEIRKEAGKQKDGDAWAQAGTAGADLGWAGGYAADALSAAQSSVTASPASAPMKQAQAQARADGDEYAYKPANGPSAAGGAPVVEAQVRTKFADTAAWQATLLTDANGQAAATFKLPENLTTWKINAWAITAASRVGQDSSSALTTKNLLVRLQAPRFFLEYDEVVLSANVNNYLKAEKTAHVTLTVPEDLLKMIGEAPATVDVKVPAGGGARVDWRVKVLKEGVAKITVKALTDEESDAMQVTYPVLVHGITKQVATTGSMKPDELNKSLTVDLLVPDKRREELTYLEVRYAPSLIGAMIDALPYCIYYPYGCTEQTMSRFLPAVMTLKTLRNMGISLDDVRKIRGRLDEVRRVEKGEHLSLYWMSPIFDQAELDKMIAQSLSRIGNMQHGDGGWAWWTQGDSDTYLTAYVLYALCTAQQCDLAVDQNMLNRGMEWLRNWEANWLRDPLWDVNPQRAYSAYVLSLKKLKAEYKPEKPDKEDKRPGELLERLWEGRDKLCLYGKALLSMALANSGQEDRARTVLQNIMQFKEENRETEVAWFRTPEMGWWYWWNNDIETNAMCLRAIVRLDPKSDVAPRLVKWLLNNRRNGYYWRSTRDTTMCVAAMSDFVAASGEGKPDYTLTLDFDKGTVVKKVKINKDNFFTFDNSVVLTGAALGGGRHTLKITKEGAGALYFNTYLRYFTKEEHITAAGHELKVDRQYFKLVQIPYEVEVMGAAGQKVKEKRLRYQRVPVKDGDTVTSGDVVQVELKVASDNEYTYLCFEDAKPAGFEPTELRSGGQGQEGFWTYMELRDTKTVFFLGALGQGEHLLRYRLRAEIPGVFHALPTVLYGMYVPELRANSEEHVIKIKD
jgi:alpha-2-macroglobulin